MQPDTAVSLGGEVRAIEYPQKSRQLTGRFFVVCATDKLFRVRLVV